MRLLRALRLLIAVWLIAAFWTSSDGGIGVFDLLSVIYGGIALLIVTLVVSLVVRRRDGSFPRSTFFTSCAVIGVGWLLFFSPIPFRIRFESGARALESFAVTLPPGHSDSKTPQRVGLFTVRESEVLDDGSVRLILAHDMFDDAGVVYAPAIPPVIGEDSYVHIRGKWWRWYRSW